MSRRRPGLNTIWPTRRDLTTGWIVTVPHEAHDRVTISNNASGVTHWLSRSEARLLARRLNQCLDASVKR